jgi:hypothetical protein
VPGYDAKTGTLTAAFLPGEGRLFALPRGYTPTDNLAARATLTTSSSFESTLEGWGRRRLNDGVRAATPKALGWSSEGHPAPDHVEWVRLDLGGRKTVRQIELFAREVDGKPGVGLPADLRVSLSTDGKRFTTIYEGKDLAVSAAGSLCVALDADRPARHVKIEGLRLRAIPDATQAPYRMQLAEIEVRAQANHARCARVTASSGVEARGWNVENLRDGARISLDPNEGWSSGATPEQDHVEWLRFDLDRDRVVREVVLFPRSAPGVFGEGFPRAINIQTSEDGQTWTTVAARQGIERVGAQPQVFRFGATETRYVRVEGTELGRIESELNRPYRMQLAEVEIR